MGTWAVHLARHLGAEVTGVCSRANVEPVASLGALRRCRAVLAPGGACVSVDDGTPNLRRENLVLLGELAARDEIRPVIDRTYALDNIVEAHRCVDMGIGAET